MAELATLAALRVSPYVKVLILLIFVKVAKIANLSPSGSLARLGSLAALLSIFGGLGILLRGLGAETLVPASGEAPW